MAAVSGYENKLRLRRAGELIVHCQKQLPLDYAEYKRLGGMKPVAEIRADDYSPPSKPSDGTTIVVHPRPAGSRPD